MPRNNRPGRFGQASKRDRRVNASRPPAMERDDRIVKCSKTDRTGYSYGLAASKARKLNLKVEPCVECDAYHIVEKAS